MAAFGDAVRDVLGKEVEIAGSPAGCDSRIWQNIAGCPTVQYGPGRLTECHSVDEFVHIQQYLDAILVYAGLILRWAEENQDK